LFWLSHQQQYTEEDLFYCLSHDFVKALETEEEETYGFFEQEENFGRGGLHNESIKMSFVIREILVML
jgi:hypothetical protein